MSELIPEPNYLLTSTRSAEKGIRTLKKDALQRAKVEAALERLKSNPYPVPGERVIIRHLKGEWDCSHEYRDLLHYRRIYYHVNEQDRQVEILAAGDHLT